MRRYIFTILIILCAGSVSAQTSIPFYTQHADFLFTSPGAFDNGLLGYINPANLNYVHGQDTRVMIATENNKMRSISHWGLFSASPNLGFGLIQKDGVTDYRVGLGFGDESVSFGIGYGWSRGNAKEAGRENLMSAGTLVRPNRYLSLGISGLFGLDEGQREGVFDLSIRPQGNDMLTIFGDLAFRKEMQLEDAVWSAGAALQVLPGVHLTGRYFDSKTVTAGLSVSMGTTGARGQAAFPESEELGQLYYGVRIGAPKHSPCNTKVSQPDKYLNMSLRGTVKYQRFKWFDDKTQTLSGILDDLEKAKTDPAVAGVALNLTNSIINKELAWEIREKLREIQAADKKIVAYVERGGMTMYHLASVADKIIMDPEGILTLEGYVMGRTYLKGTLEKLGLGYDEWRFFKYKSAAETLSRDSMSVADREQRQELLNDLYEVVRGDICQSRAMDPEQFDQIINDSYIMNASRAIESGLVDTLARWKDIKDIIKATENGLAAKLIPAQALSGNVLPRREWGPKTRIALVYAIGECATESGIKARQLAKIFEGLTKADQIRAVVLRVDSPGGDGLASDLVAEAMKKCAMEKPVVVSQGFVAASGGYWISMNADTIVAAPHTITGSIGVIGGWLWDKTLGEKLGMTSDFVKVGEHAELGYGVRLPLLGIQIPERNLTPDERAKIEGLILEMYKEFVAKVAEGRGLDEDAVEQIAQGRVWTGLDAKENGLVDVLGGLETAISLAREAAGIPSERDVEILEFPKPGLFDVSALTPGLLGTRFKPVDHDYEIEFLKMIARHPGQPLPVLPPDYRFKDE